MKKCSTMLYVGLDVHKESIAVAYAPDVHGAEVVSLGNITEGPLPLSVSDRPRFLHRLHDTIRAFGRRCP